MHEGRGTERLGIAGRGLLRLGLKTGAAGGIVGMLEVEVAAEGVVKLEVELVGLAAENVELAIEVVSDRSGDRALDMAGMLRG